MMRKRLCSLLLWGSASALPMLAQSARPTAHEVDLAVSYNAQRQNATTGTTFWEQGGSVDLSADVYHGLGAALMVSGGHASNISGSGLQLTTVTTVVGPRYAFGKRRLSAFGEGLIGESNALDSIFPSSGGTFSAYSFASQVGGGVDFRLSRHFAVRVMQANWLRTQFPNATTNVQNTLQLGAGVVLRLQR